MRKIKFRGYAVEEMTNSQWLFGFGVMDIDYVDGTIEWHLHTLNGTYEVFPESIGQYTGLKDKDGKEIYEGDILSDETYTNVYGEVYFEDGSFRVNLGNDRPLFEDMQDYELKVIGNLYENLS